MFKKFHFLENLLPCLGRQKQIKELAQRLYSTILEFSHVSQDSNTGDSITDVISVLQSSQSILEALLKAKTEENITDSELAELSQTSLLEKESQFEDSYLYNNVDFPIVAEDLIQLRDWVLMAKTSGDGASPEVIDAFYEKLGEILAKEGVIALEAIGVPFDYEKHQIVGIEVTGESSKNDQVFSTIRPGYLFNDLIVRSQEIILYTFEEA